MTEKELDNRIDKAPAKESPRVPEGDCLPLVRRP